METRETERPSIFLSHAQSDADWAKAIRSWLVGAFDSHLEVFVASDWHSMEMGVDWYDNVDRALAGCKLGIILVTEVSITSPWVNYELGALRCARKKTIPICVGHISKADLPSPFDRSQACNYRDEDDRLSLLRSIANSCFGRPFVDSAAAKKAPVFPERQSAQVAVPIGHGPAIEDLFETSDRWTTVIYTCRATFTGENCPTEFPIKKALWTHLPVDEVQTASVALNHFIPAKGWEYENDVLHTVLCSQRAEHQLSTEPHSSAVAGTLPSLIERDWVIIGENNFSNLLLQMVEAYLPWKTGVGQTAKRKMSQPRPDVYVELVPRFGAPVSPGQKREVHRGGGMIAIFPNPFNIRKKILVLFGCHREGQFTLENWLRGAEVRKLVDSVKQAFEEAMVGSWALQIIIDKGLAPGGSLVDPLLTEAVSNLADQRRFWFNSLNRAIIDDSPVINIHCSQPQAMYDLSLVATLEPEYQKRLEEQVRARIGTPKVYWENDECEIGFHITLYEFCTHYSADPQVLKELALFTNLLSQNLNESYDEDRPRAVTARLRGIELLPSGLVSYVDFMDEKGDLTGWLESVRDRCEKCVSRVLRGARGFTDVLNVMKVPFPVHVTLCRFDGEVSDTQYLEFRKTATESRFLELLQIPLTKVSLAVARKTPYRSVSVIGNVELMT